jgi:hypothetical protein
MRERKGKGQIRFQPDVSAFIENFPLNVQKMLNKIRSIILHSSSSIHESIKHKIPFYSHKGFLCYINPTNEKVIIGFSHGAEFSNEDKFLIGSGKSVRHAIYRNLKEIKTARLRQLIYEALIINEILSAKPVKKNKIHTN